MSLFVSSVKCEVEIEGYEYICVKCEVEIEGYEYICVKCQVLSVK
jgi:hypothetical protein